MLNTAELIQDHIGTESRAQQAHGGLLGEGWVGVSQPCQELLFVRKDVDPFSGDLSNL